jgi:single-strand DNA-binding protein
MNKVILTGYAGKDCELRTFDSGQSIATTSLATTERWKDKSTGEKKEATEWHNIKFGDAMAQTAATHIKKGTQLLVVGKIRTRSYGDEGNKKYVTEIQVDDFEFLGSKQAADQNKPQNQTNHSPANNQAHEQADADSDLQIGRAHV